MRSIWQHYVSNFQRLIQDGWTIYRTKGSSLYRWVYPYTTLPTKFRLKEALNINNIANRSSESFGTTCNCNVACSILFSTERCIAGKV